ncbi:MAG: cytidylate kinase-like family protein [Dehalococcoidia bacterium]
MTSGCRVVCISRTLGAGAEEIGRAVASELGFRYADDEIIARAAEAAGVSPETIAGVEKTPGLVTRIAESMGRFPMAPEGWSMPVMVTPQPAYEDLIQRVINEVATEGSVVIVAHGASIGLAGTEGVLRVLINGSPEARARRLTEAGAIDGQKAAKAIGESDKQRREFLRRFYDVGDEEATHYDLVISTDILSPAAASEVVLAAAKQF